jgi:hypothetical protein
MKEEILKMLRDARDAAALRAAIIALCTPLAEVKDIDLIPGGMAGSVLCRVEPAVPKDGDAIAALFDGSRIGNCVYFSLTVNAKDFAP